MIQAVMNRYLNGMLTNEQVIEELMNLAKQIAQAKQEGADLGLTDDELASITESSAPYALSMDDRPTEFELVTAIAMKFFERKK